MSRAPSASELLPLPAACLIISKLDPTRKGPNAQCLNRDKIYQEIRKRDRNGYVTNNLLEWHEETTWDTSNAWNGSSYACYLCNSRTFRAMKDLDQHLKSPTHQQEIYHCPNKMNCRSQFKSLAGMFNHLESESCGFVKFGGVQKNVGNFLAGGQRAIGFYS
ncbi:hypothetical protein ACLMJK_001808 [Lecanora helva]